MAKTVFVLQDSSDGMVYCVTKDSDAAEEWVGFDPQYTAVEVELEDFTSFNAVKDELGLNDEEEEPEPTDDDEDY